MRSQKETHNDLPVFRSCRCDRPLMYVDNDGDELCMYCGRPPTERPAPELAYDTMGRRVSGGRRSA